MSCRACGGETRLVLDLGLQPPSNALLSRPDDEEIAYPLRLMRCLSCCLLQTDVFVPPEALFGENYPFRSGFAGWDEHFRCLADTLTHRFEPSFVVDIGGNDGSLLSHFACKTLNVEPSGVAEVSRKRGIKTLQLRWEETELRERADLILGTNVLAHTPDLDGFIASVTRNLNGTAVFEFPWVMDMLNGGQFDTIYHEHYSYLSLTALMPIFAMHGLTVYDVEHLPTHGGSLRIYVGNGVVNHEVAGILTREEPLWHEAIYRDFRERAEVIRETFRMRLRPGMYAYGAAAKGNTLLNWCGITWKDIVAVGDSTPAKQGRYLPGSHIPVISEQAMIDNDPKAVAILPWNWADGIIERLRPLLPDTEFVVP